MSVERHFDATGDATGDQRPAAHVAVLLAAEGDVADALTSAEGTGGGEQGGHAAGVVVGPRRAVLGILGQTRSKKRLRVRYNTSIISLWQSSRPADR